MRTPRGVARCFRLLVALAFILPSAGRADVVVHIDPHRNPKPSGVDVFLYVPTVEFVGAQPTDYVYFYCVFDNPWKPVTSAVTLRPKGPGAVKWGLIKPLSP